MFDTVVIAIDDYAGGRDAVRLARELVSPRGELILVNVDVVDVDGRTHGRREQHRATLARVAREAGIRHVASINATSVASGLHDFAQRGHADLLVLGCTREGGSDHELVGLHARDTVDDAPSAVAIAPAGYATGRPQMGTIGTAFNGSPASAEALSVARRLACARGARISVFESIGLPPHYFHAMLAGDPAAAHSTPDEMLRTLPTIVPVQEFGDPREALTVYSESVDLLVVGAGDFGPLGRFFRTRDGSHVSHTARCPLIVVPRPEAIGSGAATAGVGLLETPA